MGSGKSSVAQRLAKRLNFLVIDLDELIVRNEGLSIPDIFETQGESHFRKLESEALISIKKQSNIVLSTGGGTPIENQSQIQSLGFVVYLHTSFDTCLDRCQNDPNRPLLKKDTHQLLKLWQMRDPIYHKVSDFCIKTDLLNTEEIAKQVLTAYNTSHD